jgi:hypothetical protein
MINDKIKGACVKSVLAFLQREGLLVAALSEVSPMTRELFGEGVLSTNWYSADAYIELLDAASARAGMGAQWLMIRLGKQIVSDGLSTVYRVFLPVESPFLAVSRGHFLWRTYFKHSELILLRADKGEAEFEVRSEPSTSVAYCLTKLGGMIGALEIIGARSVQGEHASCRGHGDEHCRFRLSWDE